VVEIIWVGGVVGFGGSEDKFGRGIEGRGLFVERMRRYTSG
jgi:hypothetical protein